MGVSQRAGYSGQFWGNKTPVSMAILFFMIGVSLLMALGFLGAFVWSMRSGQQDDLYTPSLRMLLDDNAPPPEQPPAAQLRNQFPTKTSTNAV